MVISLTGRKSAINEELDECFTCSEGVFAADFVAIIAAGCSWSLIFMFGCEFQALYGLALSSCSVNVQV
ncbi:hypothetical protein QQP08_008071 [Theobroma cacao]|nr:hypothetical protein QQP08_008071 [Theobroma cacao]